MRNHERWHMTNGEWGAVGDTACVILTKIYVENRESFERAAAAMGGTLEQLAAAAVTGMVRVRMESNQLLEGSVSGTPLRPQGPRSREEAAVSGEKIPRVLERLGRIEAALDQLLRRGAAKGWYTVEEFAAVVGKAPFTCREWCRLGRVNAEKRRGGRGKFQEWVISHEELLRFEREGLLPLRGSPSLN
jgi:hypothetical protein